MVVVAMLKLLDGTDNTSSKIEETIIELANEFDIELHEAEETVNHVLSMTL